LKEHPTTSSKPGNLLDCPGDPIVFLDLQFSRLIRHSFQILEIKTNQTIPMQWLTKRQLTTRIGNVDYFKGSWAILNMDLEDPWVRAWPKANKPLITTRRGRGALDKHRIAHMRLKGQMAQ
jgi:hypothetical protein